MLIEALIPSLRETIAGWRDEGARVAFVPTMGNLHEGHLSLVREARRRIGSEGRVVASIFVNPLQFGANEDLDAYPHTPEEDVAALEAEGVDLLFRPEEAELYPNGRESQSIVEAPAALTNILCGASRPGHFRGVTTVVAKLFNIVQPDLALFGEKDYQQLAVLRRMVADLNMPIEIIGVSTVREADGLAMSSRNGYLSEDERHIASGLQRSLRELAARIEAGERDYEELLEDGRAMLELVGFEVDYLELRRADDLGGVSVGDHHLILLAAAFLGRARLIDNLLITI